MAIARNPINALRDVKALRNGVNLQFTDINVNMLGVDIDGITQISYGETQAKENSYAGNSYKPYGRGYGQKEYNFSMTVYKDELLAINEASKAFSPTGSLIDIPPFDVTISFIAEGKTHTDIIKGVEFTESSFDISQGDMSIPYTLTFIVADISFSV